MKKVILLGLMLCAITLSACARTSTSNEQTQVDQTTENDLGTYSTITPEEAYERMQSKDVLVIVDVRTLEEYNQGHIDQALLIPNEEIMDTQPALLPDKDAEILVYCRSGRRSAIAAQKLADMGYTNIKDFGGINDWPYETVDTQWEEK